MHKKPFLALLIVTKLVIFIVEERVRTNKFVYERTDQLSSIAGEWVKYAVSCGRKCARTDQCESFYFMSGRCLLVVPFLEISTVAPPYGEPWKLYVRAP